MCLIYTLYLTGLKNIHNVPKSSVNEVLLTIFHKQEQKSLGVFCGTSVSALAVSETNDGPGA